MTNLRQRLAQLLERLTPRHLPPSPGVRNPAPARVSNEILERAIDGTDPKIRLVPGHRRRLERAIGASLGYIEEIIGNIPASVDLFSHHFTEDPHVNAFFATPEALRESLRHSQELSDYLRRNAMAPGDACWSLLCMRMQERHILGMDLSGDQVRHDVPQTAISFDDHQFLSPADSEQAAREGLKQCLFQGLITSAVAELAGLRARRRRIATRLRVLRGRLRDPNRDDRRALENEISRLTQELQKSGLATPQACLQRVESTFLHPERFVTIERFSLRLDKMGILVDDHFSGPCNQLELARAGIAEQPPRIVVLARLHACDIDGGAPAGTRRFN